MKKRFSVIVDGIPISQENQIARFFENSFEFWHHLRGFWLLIDSTGEWDVEKIRSAIQEHSQTAHIFVFEHTEKTKFSCTVPNNAVDWLKIFWTESIQDRKLDQH